MPKTPSTPAPVHARIVECMLRNHLHHSKPASLKSGAGPSVGPTRVIVVVGAGASHSAAGLPLGSQAVDFVRKAVLNKYGGPDLIDRAIHETSLKYRLEPNEFETIMLALSTFGRETVLDELSILFRRRCQPVLPYEVLAHLLKHRFVDAVVDFNFDELLDQSLEDEMGPGQYKRIVSDGDCPERPTDLFQADDLTTPLFIKPHGTISSESTLRFTRTDYVLMPRQISALLGALFCNAPFLILTIGHAMASFEFNKLLSSARTSTGSSTLVELIRIDSSADFTCPDPVIRSCYDRHKRTLLVSGTGPTLEGAMTSLWKELDATVSSRIPGVRLRGIERHQLISNIFRTNKPLHELPQESLNEPKSGLADYFHNRAYLELAMLIAKFKGFITIDEVAASRANWYFSMSARGHTSNKKQTLFARCCDLGLVPNSYSRDTLRLSVGKNFELDRIIINRSDFVSKGLPLLTRKLGTVLLGQAKRWLAASENVLVLKKTLTTLYDKDEIEMSPREGRVVSKYLSSPIILHTLTALASQTLSLVNTEWSRLFSVAESGKWLLQPQVIKAITRCSRKSIVLIVADRTYEKDILEEIGNVIPTQILWLPWWLHNLHMTVVTDVACTSLHKGIFFCRRFRASRIDPLAIDLHEDIDVLMNMFSAYRLKASRLVSGGTYTKEMFIDREIVEAERQSIFGL